jgi:hypothetical protein
MNALECRKKNSSMMENKVLKTNKDLNNNITTI